MNRTCMPEPLTTTIPGSSTASHTPVVRFVDVSKEYSADEEIVHALSGVDLEIEGGEFVALVGRSGCGKSDIAEPCRGDGFSDFR